MTRTAVGGRGRAPPAAPGTVAADPLLALVRVATYWTAGATVIERRVARR